MATVKFTRHLKRYFPELDEMSVEATDVLSVVQAIDAKHDGFAHYVIDDQNRLRKHVNIFIGSEMISDRVALSDVVQATDEIFIMQALSGG